MKGGKTMNAWEAFGKYVGIQGLLALGLGTGYIYLSVTGGIVPEGYENLLLIILGFYFGKNGNNILGSLTKSVTPR